MLGRMMYYVVGQGRCSQLWASLCSIRDPIRLCSWPMWYASWEPSNTPNFSITHSWQVFHAITLSIIIALYFISNDVHRKVSFYDTNVFTSSSSSSLTSWVDITLYFLISMSRGIFYSLDKWCLCKEGGIYTNIKIGIWVGLDFIASCLCP